MECVWLQEKIAGVYPRLVRSDAIPVMATRRVSIREFDCEIQNRRDPVPDRLGNPRENTCCGTMGCSGHKYFLHDFDWKFMKI